MSSGLMLPIVVMVGLALLPSSVSANAGPGTTAPPSGAAGTVNGPAWAAPAAIIATLRSLSLALQSLFNRLASARVARGDLAGAERARNIANTMGNGLQWWAGLGTMSWDYITNYVFTQSVARGMGLPQAMGHLSDLSSIVAEVTQLGSDGERLQWLARNYSRAFAVAKSALGNLLSVFDHDGAIRNCVLAIQREFLEGDLLRDVLRLGPTDFESIVRMSKDVLQRIFASAQNGQGQRDAEL